MTRDETEHVFLILIMSANKYFGVHRQVLDFFDRNNFHELATSYNTLIEGAYQADVLSLGALVHNNNTQFSPKPPDEDELSLSID